MKIFVVAFVFAFALLGAACHIPTPTFDVGVCTAGRLGPQIVAVRPRVLACLQTAGYVGCLAGIAKDLGVDVGKDIVLCAVREFTGAGATPTTDPEVHDRAAAYLAANGVQP